MLRILISLSFIVSGVFAKWCVFYSTQTKVYRGEDRKFYRLFPDAKIINDGQYYRFLIGPYDEKKDTYRILRKARRYKKDAFIRRCDKYLNNEVAQQEISKANTFKEHRCTKKATQVNLQAPTHFQQSQKDIQISEVFKRPILKKIQRQKRLHKVASFKSKKKIKLSSQNSKAKKKTVTHKALHKQDEKVVHDTLESLQHQPYYTLSYYEFMNRFLFESPYGKSEDYAYRLKKLDALLEDVPYNWDVFAHAAISYTKFIDFTLKSNRELDLQGGLGVSKRLFDSGYYIKKSIKRLRQKLAKMDYINAKDRLYLYGSELYINALLQQKIKDLYEQNFYEQKAFRKLVRERYKAQVASRVDDIDAEDDFLNIKKNLLESEYAYLYSDYLLRNAAELNISKPLKLSWFGVAQDGEKSLREYYKNALEHSPKILAQETKQNLESKKILKYRYFYFPQVDFNALVYEEYSKNNDAPGINKASGLNYLASLNIKIPLYNKSNSDQLQKQKLQTLYEHERLKSTIKDVLKDIHKTYNEIKKLNIKKAIVQKQYDLAKEKIDLTKKRYLSGVGSYRDYSDAINEMLSYKQQLYEIDAQLLSNKIFLNLLEGINRPYEQN